MAKNIDDKKIRAYNEIMKGSRTSALEDIGPLVGSEIHLQLHGTEDKNRFLKTLMDVELDYPIDVVIKRATRDRTLAQNRTQWQWFRDAQRQGDQTADEYRGFCKLHFGVPILRRDSVEYREMYDSIVRSMTYDKKLKLMMTPLDFPVTSGMNVAQHSEYLDQVKLHFESMGFQLTEPYGWES